MQSKIISQYFVKKPLAATMDARGFLADYLADSLADSLTDRFGRDDFSQNEQTV